MNPLSGKSLIIIGFPGTQIRRRYHEYAGENGIDIHYVNATLDDFERKVVKAHIPANLLDFGRHEEVIQNLIAYSIENKIDGILSYIDLFNEVAQRVALEMGWPTVGKENIPYVRNKLRMHELYEKADIPSARYKKIATIEDARKAADELGLPMVFKPVEGGGSWAVVKISSKDEIEPHCSKVMALSRDTFKHDYFIAEEYLEGFECSVEALIYHGKVMFSSITEKPLPMEGPYFPEVMHLSPSSYDDATQRELLELVAKLVERGNIYQAAMHVEFRMTSDGPKILECGSRVAGGEIPTIVRHVYGTDIISGFVDLALDIPPKVSNQGPCCFSGFIGINQTKTGLLKKIYGTDEARNVKGILDVILIPENSEIKYYDQAACNAVQLGFIVAKGNSKEDVLNSLNTAHDCLSFVIE